MKSDQRLILAKDTLWNLTTPLLDRDLAAIAAGTAGGTPSKLTSVPCCGPDVPVTAPKAEIRRKPRGRRRY
jgi:hypothetical protein